MAVFVEESDVVVSREYWTAAKCVSSQRHNAEYKSTGLCVLQTAGKAFVFEKGFYSSSQYWVNVSARKATPFC